MVKKFIDIHKEFLRKWITSGLLKKRSRIIEQSLICFEQELYFAAIPLVFSQLEGLIADEKNHIGQMQGWQLRNYMKEIFNSSGNFSYDYELLEFYGHVLTEGFEHGRPLKSILSRHAIVHGADVEYGTRENYIKVILFLDSVHDKLAN